MKAQEISLDKNDIEPIDKIKKILFQSELNKIDDYLEELKDQVQNIKSDDYKDELVIKSLSKAIDVNAKDNNNSLAQSLAPIISASLLEQVKNDSDKIIDALYPVMGSIITKFMSASIKDLTDSINQKIEQKLSVGTMVRRFKSKVTGVSEAELLFKKSMGAKFQSIYLIHKKTGVLIAETHSDKFSSENSHMIAGLFSAITSFVEDWISKSDDMAMLDAIDYGNMKIIFEKSSSYIVAAVIEGQSSSSLRAPLQKLLSLIHVDFSQHFVDFSGDVSAIPEQITDNLNSILSIDKAQKSAQSADKNKKLIVPVLTTALLVVVVWFGYGSYSNAKKFKKYNNILATSPFFSQMAIDVDIDGDNINFKGIVADINMRNNLEKTMKMNSKKGHIINTKEVKILNVGFYE